MYTMKKICIIGAGNVGVATAVDLSQNNDSKVFLFTSKASVLQKNFCKIDSDTNQTTESKSVIVTSNEEDAFKNTDLIIVTYPSFLIKELIQKISKFNPKMVLFVPGFGSKELYSNELVKNGCVIAGFDRSPYVARLSNDNIVVASKKQTIRIGCLNSCNINELSSEISALFSIQCFPLKNYLTVTFTPSNPILHTARLFSMFKNMDFNTPIPDEIKFYGNWDDESSELLLNMDNELQKICQKFKNIDLSGVIPLSIHYESNTIKDLTKKIVSIQSWHDLKAPLKRKNDYYVIDSESRYFKEDFMFGLCIIKGYAKIVSVKTPFIDKVLKWFENISGEVLFDKAGCFNGKSIEHTGIPQNFGINNIKDIENMFLYQ